MTEKVIEDLRCHEVGYPLKGIIIHVFSEGAEYSQAGFGVVCHRVLCLCLESLRIDSRFLDSIEEGQGLDFPFGERTVVHG